MASALKNLSDYNQIQATDFSIYQVAIVVSEYHSHITEKLCEGALETLLKEGFKESNLFKAYAPGAYELPLAAQYFAGLEWLDAVICLGCIIQGETKHFDFISQAVANGVMNVGLQYNKPVIFGVLTPENEQQAIDRSGGKYGNKGVEAAVAAIKMLQLKGFSKSI